MIGTLCISLIGYRSVLVFFTGNAIGAYFQYFFGSQELDNCGGISFGVYSLFGFILGFNLLVWPILPQGFAISLLIVVLIGLFFSELLIPNSASVGHFTGLLFGALSSVLFLNKNFLSITTKILAHKVNRSDWWLVQDIFYRFDAKGVSHVAMICQLFSCFLLKGRWYSFH